MFVPAYLSLSRHGIYYFRWPISIPKHAPKSYVKVSLGTRDPREALQLARGLSNLGELLTSPSFGLHSMEHIQLKEIIRGYFSEYLNRFKQRIDERGPLTDQQTDEFLNTLNITEAAITENDLSWFPELDDRIQVIVKNNNLDNGLSEDTIRNLKALYLQGNKAYFERALKYSSEANDVLIDVGSSPRPLISIGNKSNPPLEELINLYIDEQSRSVDGWSRTTKDERTAQLNVLMDILGKDFDIAAITHRHAIEIKQQIMARPRNANKKKTSLRASDLLPDDSDKLSNTTVNNYLSCYASFTTWAKNHEYTKQNEPFGTMKLKRKRNERKKVPFSLENMQKIFAGLAELKTRHVVEDHHYWGGMIAAYTGARLNEIASLYKKNIKQVDGIWIFEIDDELADKSVKTEASVRKVPIHSSLIQLGFLDFYNDCKHERLFHKLPYHYKDKYGRNLGRWWNESFLKDIEVKTKEKTFHCFRHTVSSQLQFQDVQEPLIQALIGHEQDSTMQKYYTGGVFKVSQLKETIEKLFYSVTTKEV